MTRSTKRLRGSRTPIHPAFARAVELCGPIGLQVRSEVVLTREPRRADLVLRLGRGERMGARIFKGLWRHMPPHVVVEFRSIANEPRRGDWVRLLAYALQYDGQALQHRDDRAALAMLFVVPRWTDVLGHDLDRMAWRLEDLGCGYREVHGGPFPSFLALLDEVALAEQDPVAALFGPAYVDPHVPGALPEDVAVEMSAYLADLEDAMKKQPSDEVRALAARFIQRLPPEVRLAGLPPEVRLAGLPPEVRLAGLLPEQRLAGLPPEVRLAGLPPEERLAGLDVAQAVLAFPTEALRALSDAFLDSLPPEVREEVRRRLDEVG